MLKVHLISYLLIAIEKTVSRTDNDDRVTVDDGGATPRPPPGILEDGAHPGELVLRGVFTSNYSGVHLTTTWVMSNVSKIYNLFKKMEL